MRNKLVRNIFFLVLLALVATACHRLSIKLDKVANLPVNFNAAKHFGISIDAITQKNEILLVTGLVERDELPPLKRAVICTASSNIFLPLTSYSASGIEKAETYSGNGYTLRLSYIEHSNKLYDTLYSARLIIQHQGKESRYKLVGTTGYH